MLQGAQKLDECLLHANFASSVINSFIACVDTKRAVDAIYGVCRRFQFVNRHFVTRSLWLLMNTIATRWLQGKSFLKEIR